MAQFTSSTHRGKSPTAAQALIHEVRDDTMEVEPIVEARLGQVDEIGRGDGHPWDGKKKR